MRISVASAGNDHRLGANEAPPAIISIYLGSVLTELLEAVEQGCEYTQASPCKLNENIHALPNFAKDTADRNRTSPFAFTGNKFEFRMPGSSSSVSGPNVILNTIVADVLDGFATKLEQTEDVETCLREIVRNTVNKHKRIIFNGNNYSDEWVSEAASRGLLNLPSTADALPYFVRDENIALFQRQQVFTPAEMHSRLEISLDEYCKILNIEAITMLQMSKKSIIPAISKYTMQLAQAANAKKQLDASVDYTVELSLVKELSSLLSCFLDAVDALDEALIYTKNYTNATDCARYYRDTVFACMQELRSISDAMEIKVSKKCWPWPTYGDILFSV